MKNSIFSYFHRVFLDSKGCISTSLVNKISKVTIPGKVLLTKHKALQLKKKILQQTVAVSTGTSKYMSAITVTFA